MQNEFRRLKFGLVPADMREPHIESAEQILISYLRTCGAGNLMSDSVSAIEVYSIAKRYIGKNFKNWVLANFNSGVGVRASLARKLVLWADNKTYMKGITGEVRRDLNRLDFLKTSNPQLQTQIIYDDTPGGSSTIDVSNVTDRLFYEFITGMGPELTAHFLLSLNGIRFSK